MKKAYRSPSPWWQQLIGVGLVAALLLIASYLYVAWRPPLRPAPVNVHLVAAENFWGNIASQIGGPSVGVTSIITDPNADPHLYESNARDAGAIAGADVVVENGLGYDDFMDKLLAASPSSTRQVLSASTILGVTGADANPHLWYDIPRVKLVAEAIEKALADKDPGDRSAYETSLASFEASLQPLLDEISMIKTKDVGVPVAYTERVPGYLLADIGLSVKTPTGFASAVEDGNSPSPADTQAMESLITGHHIKALLYNAQATNPVTEQIQTLAKADHIPVVAVTETMPGRDTYQSWQLEQLKALAKALDN